MRKFTSWRGSPALAVAVLAVAVGLVGQAMAGRSGSASPSRAEVKKLVRKQVRKQVRALAPKLSVARARHAGTADRATSSVTAEKADLAEQAELAWTSRNSEAVNGFQVERVRYEGSRGSTSETIFAGATMGLRAVCPAEGEMSIEATTAQSGSSIFSSAVDTNADDNNSNADRGGGTFGPGDRFDLLAGAGDSSLVTFQYVEPGRHSTPLVGMLTAEQLDQDGGVCRAQGVVFHNPPRPVSSLGGRADQAD